MPKLRIKDVLHMHNQYFVDISALQKTSGFPWENNAGEPQDTGPRISILDHVQDAYEFVMKKVVPVLPDTQKQATKEFVKFYYKNEYNNEHHKDNLHRYMGAICLLYNKL